MKIRNGFVSNSSSSSFVIAKSYMTEDQLFAFNLFLNEFRNSEGKIDIYGYEYTPQEIMEQYYIENEKNYFHGSGEQSFQYIFTDKLKELGLGDKIGYFTP